MTVLLNRTGRMYGYAASGTPTVYTLDLSATQSEISNLSDVTEIGASPALFSIPSIGILRHTSTGAFQTAVCYLWNPGAIGSNQFAEWTFEAVVGGNAKQTRIFIRASDNGTGGGDELDGYRLEVRTTNSPSISLASVVSGTATPLGTTYTYTAVANDVFRIEANGDQISVKVNGVTQIGPVTNSDHTGGPAGFQGYMDLSGATVDFSDVKFGDL